MMSIPPSANANAISASSSADLPIGFLSASQSNGSVLYISSSFRNPRTPNLGPRNDDSTFLPKSISITITFSLIEVLPNTTLMSWGSSFPTRFNAICHFSHETCFLVFSYGAAALSSFSCFSSFTSFFFQRDYFPNHVASDPGISWHEMFGKFHRLLVSKFVDDGQCVRPLNALILVVHAKAVFVNIFQVSMRITRGGGGREWRHFRCFSV